MSEIVKQADKARIHTIPPGAAFLETLARELVEGKLVSGFVPAEDPSLLADATIYLPTRRAARKFGLEIFNAMHRATGSKATLLPAIRTLGDLDEEEILFGLANPVGADVPLDLGKVTPPPERLLQLARLALAWKESLTAETRDLFNSEQIVLPSSAADAIRLAAGLVRFLDQVETEETPWTEFAGVVPADQPWSKWWQLTLTFLQILMEHWPQHLEERGEIGPAEFRRRLIDHRASVLGTTKGPVIAAGSTGSIPATARLISTIATLPHGAVALPGYDIDLPEDARRTLCEIREFEAGAATSTHPQFGLVRLVNEIGKRAGSVSVEELGAVPEHLRIRDRAINFALLPSAFSNTWHDLRKTLDTLTLQSAFADVSLIEAAEETEEARAIALCLRKALETPGKTAALVTPDRNLARRVSGELERYGIAIDDSAGVPFSSVASAQFLVSLLLFVMEPGDPVIASALLKSPLCTVDQSPARAAELCELIELAILRGRVKQPDPADLKNAIEIRRLELEEDPYAPAILKTLPDDEWEELAGFAGRLSGLAEPLQKLADSGSFTIPAMLETLATTANALSIDDTGRPGLANTPGARELAGFFESFSSVKDAGHILLKPEDAAPVFRALTEEIRIREGMRTHPRLNIYGPLEARLQTPDLVILAGLNEGSWPNVAANDQFLNRPMRASLGLPLPERRAGLAAHDFAQLSGITEVVYSRSQRSDNAPSVASRWLQRLTVFLGDDVSSEMRQRGNELIDLANQMDRPRKVPPVHKSPEPRPPVSIRPNILSITEIETWIRDPYAIYARHVLGVRALPPLVREADAALRGSIHHQIFAEFISGWRGEIDDTAGAQLTTIADRQFSDAELPPEIAAAWRPRFDAIAASFLDWEADRRPEIERSVCEINARMEIPGTGFTLKGRADRIDILRDGSLSVIDYKSGTNPSAEQARTLAPQLSLEGAMARAGEFRGVPAMRLGGLSYVRLREGDEFREDDISLKNGKPEWTAGQLADQAMENLVRHIASYSNPEQPYQSRFAVFNEAEASGEYDHLARVREWSLGGDDSEADG